MKKIIIQCGRWCNLLAHHHGGAGRGGVTQTADVRGEWRWSACRNAEGTSAPDPSRDKAKLQKYPFFFGWEISGILSVITEKQAAASILLSPSVRSVGSDQRTWFVLTLYGLIMALQSISVLMQWMWIISLVLLKLVVYLKFRVGVLCMNIKAPGEKKAIEWKHSSASKKENFPSCWTDWIQMRLPRPPLQVR